MAWSWESVLRAVALPDVITLLNQRMKSLENHLGIIATTATVDGKVLTTNATVTTIKTVTVPVSTSLAVWGYVVARRTGGAAGTAEDGAAYRVEFVAKNAAGTATVIGSTVTVIGESQGGWDCTVAASGGNVLIRGTGSANNNVTWYWSGQQVGVKS